jgi:hypothetical protein
MWCIVGDIDYDKNSVEHGELQVSQVTPLLVDFTQMESARYFTSLTLVVLHLLIVFFKHFVLGIGLMTLVQRI